MLNDDIARYWPMEDAFNTLISVSQCRQIDVSHGENAFCYEDNCVNKITINGTVLYFSIHGIF